jgi:Zn finger protein HypA/HybF involved in hydrogenase expression
MGRVSMIFELISSLFNKEKYRMKIKTSLREMEKNFLGNVRQLLTCPKCKKDYLNSALDFKEVGFVCPRCDNGKD